MPRRTTLVVAAVAALALSAVAFIYRQTPAEGARSPTGEARLAIDPAGIGRLLKATLPDAESRPTAVSTWQGKILVVNFWATWCPPCIKEMPELSQTSSKYAGKGVQFVGIGIDSPSAIKEYLLRQPVSYPILIGGTEGLEIARGLGNGSTALPFTVILDAGGRPLFARLGAVDAAQLDKILAPLVAG
jgi:thiol-disulfide isomerase/thioredoxin